MPPLAATVKETVEPAQTDCETGCVVILGGVPVQFEVCEPGVDGTVPA